MFFKTLYCICGETCSGKDTLVNRLINEFPKKFKPVISYTTRPKRENETDGVEHYFVSKEKFNYLKSKKKILAYTKISSRENPDGYEYMALKNELKKANIYIIDPNGIETLKKMYPHIRLKIIYIYSSMEQREERAKKYRSDYNEEFHKRMEQESEQFEIFRSKKKYDYVIHNVDSCEDISYSKLRSILLSN